MLRILVLFALVRVGARGEAQRLQATPLDYTLLAYALVLTTAYTIREGDFSAFVNRAGILLRRPGHLFHGPRPGAHPSRRDHHGEGGRGVLHGVGRLHGRRVEHGPEHVLGDGGRSRDHDDPGWPPPLPGGLRPHRSSPGSSAPAGSRSSRPSTSHKQRALAIAGGVASALIVVFSSSSTPVLGLAIALGAMALWYFRIYVPWMRRITYASLVLIHIFWQHPVWFLLARINVVGGSTGYHRYKPDRQGDRELRRVVAGGHLLHRPLGLVPVRHHQRVRAGGRARRRVQHVAADRDPGGPVLRDRQGHGIPAAPPQGSPDGLVDRLHHHGPRRLLHRRQLLRQHDRDLVSPPGDRRLLHRAAPPRTGPRSGGASPGSAASAGSSRPWPPEGLG